MLHTTFQNQGIEPGVLMGFRTKNEPISAGERVFILESMRKAVEEGDTTVKVNNFSKKKKGGAG